MRKQPDSDYISFVFARFWAERAPLVADQKARFESLIEDLMTAMLEGHSCLVVAGDDLAVLNASGLVTPGGDTPFTLLKNRLYLHRYFHYESRLARQDKELAKRRNPCLCQDAQLDRTFGKQQGGETDWQRAAAVMAMERSLTVISGGPGTGKTSTVVRIIALLLENYGSSVKIALAAPTGKAAMRLQESLRSSIAALPVSEEIRTAVPLQATTVHRLLGAQRYSPQFRHNHTNPLECDVLIVDEASMVDLALMSKLVDSLKWDSRLILIGDKDQLVSVESGAVLADLIDGLSENTVVLRKSYRFDANIKKLAETVNRGEAAKAWQLLQDASIENLQGLHEPLVGFVVARYAGYMKQAQEFDGSAGKIAELFAVLHSFRVLCAVQRGAQGVAGINLAVEQALARKGLISRSGEWYPGRPVLVRSNDYSLDLYNGDVGICLPDSAGEMKVWFEKSAGSFMSYPPFRLPQCDTVFAMTIHKSQGSEFQDVLVVLPDEENPLLSRELLYIGFTRARKSVFLDCSSQIWGLALARSTQRFTGLYDMLT